MTSWLLAVDESGTFDGGDPAAVVVGLLLRDAPPSECWAPWRVELGRRVSTLPWPPHGAHGRYPVGLRALCAAHPRRDGAGLFPDDLGALAAVVRADGRPEVQETLAALRRGGRVADVSMEVLARVDAGLRRSHPGAAARVALQAHLEHEALDAAVAELALRHQGALVVARVRCPHDGDAPPPALLRDLVLRDRYVRALEALVERAAWLTWEPGGRTDLELVVADRQVSLPPLRRRSQLFPWGLRLVADVAVDAPPPGLAIRARGPWPYDGDAHPLIVLADHLARRVRRALRDGGALVEVAAALGVHGALGHPAAPLAVQRRPAWAGAELPTLAADGVARERIRAARQGADSGQPAAQPAWNEEQCRAWCLAPWPGTRP